MLLPPVANHTEIAIAEIEMKRKQEDRADTETHDKDTASIEDESSRLALFSLDQSVDAVFWIDSTARFIYANQAACLALEYSSDELLTMRVPDIDPRFSEERWLAHWKEVRKNRSFMFESVNRTKSGKTFPVEVTINCLTLCDKEYNCVFIRNIAKRKQTEQELIQARQAAEAASRSKSEFLANMSHEIRTPMTAILGFADILANSAVDQEAVQAAHIIKRNGEHLLEIINGILDLSRIESGKDHIDEHACCCSQIVVDVVATMKITADAKGLFLTSETVGNVPDCICTDSIRLRQILVNLIGNAVKFTEIGGVRVVTQVDSDATNEPKLRFDVVDTGIGMSEKDIEKIFQPFSQADSSTRRRFGGTGLGLAISQRLAKMLGGDIAVTSMVGKGSIFTLTIALHSPNIAHVRAHPSETDDKLPQRSVRDIRLNGCILLAEDGPDNQRLICHILRKAGAEVTVAHNGKTALELALAAQQSGRPFDVILMDMQMPVMDGYEATSHLRTAGYTGPIVALTAHAMLEDRRKCLDVGCNDYTTKPVDRTDLLEITAKHVNRQPNVQAVGTSAK
jgi:PAS domain S-box-containing protein